MRVAFIGLGAIGFPMAARVSAAGLDLTIWNRTDERAQEFASAHRARVGASPAEAARGAAVVITCLSTSLDVESILDGPNGLLAGIEATAILVDCTSGDPAVSRRIASRLAERGARFLDAPVSGGVNGAKQGTLTIMCGGDAETLAAVRQALECFGQKIVLCGPVGAGHAVKAVNQAFLAIHIWSAAEGLVALQKAGVDPAVALDVINASSGRSNTSMNLFPERVLTRAFPRTFRLALLDKDLRIAADFMRDQKVASPLTQLTSEFFRTARGLLGEQADHVEAYKVVEDWAGK